MMFTTFDKAQTERFLIFSKVVEELERKYATNAKFFTSYETKFLALDKKYSHLSAKQYESSIKFWLHRTLRQINVNKPSRITFSEMYEPSFDPGLDEAIDFKQKVSQVRSELTQKQKSAFDDYMIGFTTAERASMNNTTRHAQIKLLNNILKRIKNKS